ncbi:RHS domain-containing protein [Pseudomonas sp. EGD-AKN5]|uniref:RHS domain-containing protein n=1 Tax=Pseudomonas sp. EGD-AKN5 TaxID=1524461 RepID=UPI001CE0C432|nr:RHS domain-containing protein [Pseudomonas sp. EGD-AKN5]
MSLFQSEEATSRVVGHAGRRRTTEGRALLLSLDHLGTPQELTSYGGEILWSAHYRASLAWR